jgi:hypothetical protein
MLPRSQHKSIIHLIEALRLRKLGHVERMPEKRDVEKIYKWRLIASRTVARLQIRWTTAADLTTSASRLRKARPLIQNMQTDATC